MTEVHDVVIRSNVRVPMRDGVELATDFYHPPGQGPFPAVLERTPYNREESAVVRTGTPHHLARHGYLVAIQDVRGRFGSDGIWYPFRCDGWGELRDGYDTVEWLAAHQLCNGKVGTLGGSFSGQTQMLLAPTRPPHLVCCFVREAASDLANQWLYRGGAFELAFNIDWNLRHTLSTVYKQFGAVKESIERKPAVYSENPWLIHPAIADPFAWLRDSLQHPDKDAFFQPFDLTNKYRDISVPMFHLGGWFDIFLGGCLENFFGLCNEAKTARARSNQRMLIGPWPHGPSKQDPDFARMVGDLDFGEQAAIDLNRLILEWFDHWLADKPKTSLPGAKIEYFLMGANRWQSCDTWPPEGSRKRKLYLGRNGSAHALTSAKPVSTNTIAWKYDPDQPTPSIGGNTLYSLATKRDSKGAVVPDLTAMAGPRDQNPIREQCACFRSDRLQRFVRVVGPCQATLYVSSSVPDSDFVVRLCDVFPDGRSIQVADGILRARYRSSRQRPRLLQKGKTYRIVVDLWSTAWEFAAGHHIEVMINSSCFPRFDVNPNTGESISSSPKTRTARNKLHFGNRHPSVLEFYELGN